MDAKFGEDKVQRAVDLGRSNNPDALPELVRLLKMPSAEVRRLAASAIRKLARCGADPRTAVEALAPVALSDRSPLTQEYALSALKLYGAAAHRYVNALEELAVNPVARNNVRRKARVAAAAIRKAVLREQKNPRRKCGGCGREITWHEWTRSDQAFQRAFCDSCFDETFLRRRNFEMRVELSKCIKTKAGTLVQSDGERLIADWLTLHGIAYRYDERIRLLDGHAIRPDFYLPELDVYIEYWGLDSIDYQIAMRKKQQLYQQQHRRLISVFPSDKDRLNALLCSKLGLFGYHIPAGTAQCAGLQ